MALTHPARASGWSDLDQETLVWCDVVRGGEQDVLPCPDRL